jgi:multidrug efflux pump subunit AcrA (membrane-fusion protein)
MAKRSPILIDFLRLVLPIAVIGLGFLGMQLLGEADRPAQGDAAGSTAAIVETAVVSEHNGEFDIVVDGAVVPYRQVDIPAEVDGQINYKNPECRAGRFVTERTELLTIDDRDYQLEVTRLEQQIAQQDAAIAETDVEIQNNLLSIALAEEEVASQQAEVLRYEGLVASGAAPETRLEEQRRSERAARIQLQTLQNQGALFTAVRHRLETSRELNEIELEGAQLDLERTQVTVPAGLSGTILEDNIELHSYVRAGDVLMRIVDASHAEVRCSMRVDQLYWLWTQDAPRAQANANPDLIYEAPQTPVTVSFTVAGATYEWDGILSRYEGTGLDPRSRTVPCRVLVDDPRGSRVSYSPTSDPIPAPSLVSGMFVQVSVHTRTEVPLIAIPERALRPGNRVWLVRDGVLAVETVEVVQTVDDLVLLREDSSPLMVGDQVVVSPLSAPYPGMEVVIAEPDEADAANEPVSLDAASSEENGDE